MITDKDIERARQNQEPGQEANLRKDGLTEPALGPGDSSDSGSDMPAFRPDTDSDRNNTGERAEVENRGDDPLNEDVEADRIVSGDKAGLAHTPPDPARNGG